MNYKITAPARVACEVSLPASKSISNRVLIIRALAGGHSRILNIAKCDDTDAMLSALADNTATYGFILFPRKICYRNLWFIVSGFILLSGHCIVS